ncbi:MAG: tRNA 2-thiocytidine(32) synthetase TtcA [Acidobacteria bacterium 13_1_40CM_4_69_4]|nr:MAG: tRNA 2-thiocytidine(32) synthetase TtcA [Acidobacteria bacterium 13_1_40CM_4_69_4]
MSTLIQIELPRRRRGSEGPASCSLLKPLARRVGRAIQDFGLIQDGDRILCAMSGGKDSYAMLHLLDHLRRRAPVRFELLAVTVDQGYRGFRTDVLQKYFEKKEYAYHIERTNIAEVIDDTMPLGDTHCSMCARLRRGVLYRIAPELGCNKIALGHHADDLLETLLMSQFFNGEICSMPPILRARDGKNTVIRPLCYVWEDEIVRFVAEIGFPVICCACPACGDNSLKRKQMKLLLQKLEADHAGIKASLLRALSNIRTGHLLDRRFLTAFSDESRTEPFREDVASPFIPEADRRDPSL